MKALESELNKLKQDIERMSNDSSATASSLSEQLEEMKKEYNNMRAKVQERESEINRINNLLDKNTATLAAVNIELEGIFFVCLTLTIVLFYIYGLQPKRISSCV